MYEMPSKNVLPRSTVIVCPLTPSNSPEHSANAARPTSSGRMNHSSVTNCRRKP
jgi:hypothetical protein